MQDMATQLKIPIGESDFRLLRTEKYYFVDKSLLIKVVLNDARVILITRPRRFGKTLNLSMLRYFFDQALAPDTAALFKGLLIEAETELFQQHQGKYPVIFLTLKDLKYALYEEACAAFAILISQLYTEHS